MKLYTRIFFAILLFTVLMGYSSGFSILEQSPSGMGRALAGMTAETTDPSSLYYNPSSVAWFTRPSLVLGTHILTGDCRFDNRYGSTMDGSDSNNILGVTFIPNMALVYPIEKGLTLNLTMSATSGTETNYPWAWMGRYFAVNTSIAVIEMQPSISYQLHETLSIGLGVMFQYADMSVDQALDKPSPLLPNMGDTRLKMEGDTYTYGFTAGMTWKPLEHTTLGIGYRSKMEHEISMDTSFRGGYASMYEALLGDGSEISLTMPQNVNFGIIQELTDAWRVMADATWTDWSIMKEMRTRFKSGVEQSENMQWHDSWRFTVGTDYKLTQKWTVRCGAAYDECAVTNAYTKTCKLPDSNRYWFSAGVSYQVTENMRLDFAWTYIIFKRARIHQETSDGRYIDGDFYGYTNLCSLGLKYDF